MAGIGFALRKLTRRDDLLGIVQGYSYSALVSTGPWLFTVMALGGVSLFARGETSQAELALFRLITIYNFGFSLVYSGPIALVATRYLADLIYSRNASEAPGMLLGCLILLHAIQIPGVSWFYYYVVDLDLATRISAFANYFVISSIWIASIFISALRDYVAISRTFFFGMVAAMASAVLLAAEFAAAGMLAGFSIGLGLILFWLIARIFVEYPYKVQNPFGFVGYFRKYWDLALNGLISSLGLWADKWVMWLAPEHEVLAGGMISYPDYDSAMFLAYLTIVPSMAMFILTIETGFYEHYQRFYQDIQRHATLARIQENHRALIASVVAGMRNLTVIQGSACFFAIMLAPRIFEGLGINFAQLPMFRFGALGSFFQMLILALSIILSYFDYRRMTLLLSFVFLITNTGFSLATMALGLPFYGYGYFLATVVTFLVASLVAVRCITALPYHTFIRNNSAVQ